MKSVSKESNAMLVSFSISMGVILAAVLITFSLNKKPAFYIDLRQYPIYGREGGINKNLTTEDTEEDFCTKNSVLIQADPHGEILTQEKLTAPPWKIIAPAGSTSLVVVKEKFNVPHRTFLSIFGQSPLEYSYRIIFDLSQDVFDEFHVDKTITPAIFIPGIGDNWEIFMNGTLIRSEVHLDKNGEITSHRSQRKVRFPFDNELFISGLNVLDIRLIGDPNHENLGLFYGIPLYISDYNYVDRASSEYFPMAIIGIYFFIGIYHLLLFLMRSEDRYNLYYSLFSITLGIYFFARSSIIYRITPDTNLWARIEYAALFLFPPLFGAFFDELVRQRVLLLTKIYGALCVALSLAQGIFSLQFGEDVIIIWWPMIAISIAYIFAVNLGYAFFYRIYKEWKIKKAAAGSTGEKRSLLKEYLVQIGTTPLGNIAVGFLLAFLCGFFDIIDSMFLNIGILTSIYGFTVFTSGVAFILARRLGDLHNQLNLANITLEGTVKERTKELEEQTLIAFQASRAKTDFLANMSHELRTPLNAVLGFSELVLLDASEKKDRHALHKIHNSASQLLGIINDVLDISKIESGKLELTLKEYELPSLLNDSIVLNTVRIGNKPIRFNLELDSSLPSRVFGDELRIKQILNNLLSNAIKYTKEGAVTLSVFRGDENCSDKEICLCFTVKDSGIGIKSEDLEKIFSRFDQAGGAERRNIEGTGLGLAITRQLAELMGGGITVQSEYGKGSVFTVTVRQGVVPSGVIGKEIAQALKDASFQDRRIDQENFTRLQMPAVRVLVVDDVPSNLDVAKGFLSLYGITVDCAGSGEEALCILREKAALYDLVFMDHMMPGIDGVEVLNIIRKDIGGVHAGSIPVVALSANALIDSGKMFLEKGFQDFISKPIDALALDRILKKWIPEDKIEGEKVPETTQNKINETPARTHETLEPAQKQSLSPVNMVIEGVNTIQGFENSGGDDEGYRYMLESFCNDAGEKINTLRHILYYLKTMPNKENDNTASVLETILRTIKNSASCIGAQAIAVQAAELEDQLCAGNLNEVVAKLPDFSANLNNVSEGIKKVVSG